MDFWVIIPARYASTRLPAKPLSLIAGKPMLWHVYQNALKSGATKVIVATDDVRIQEVMHDLGVETCLTSNEHPSGTDRVAEAAALYQAKEETIIVNVQGDEPMLPPTLIRQVAAALAQTPKANIATLSYPIENDTDICNPNTVQVVCDKQGFALYFSRAPIPWVRDQFTSTRTPANPLLHQRHLGIYAYRNNYLQHYPNLTPCALEHAEALEQLRVLYHGGCIYVEQAIEDTGIGVDTPEDLAHVRQLMETKND